jgi:predicted Zn-ribbon and HTH transcriptional regulator
MTSDHPYAEVQPLQAGATAGYIEAFRAIANATPSTTPPVQLSPAWKCVDCGYEDNQRWLMCPECTASGDFAQVHAMLERARLVDRRKVAAPPTREEWTEDEGRCRKCLSPFNPDDTRHNGNARHADTPYCRYCVDLCRLSQAVLHLCEICR